MKVLWPFTSHCSNNKSLKEVKDICIWEYASWVLGLLPTSHTEDRILFNALAFVQGCLGPGDSSKAPSVEIETTSKQKQVA
ncbi:hypothetical protein CK203_062676 [Vitis vinifera]|uniref:Uncharacterized protein n=1 Tax=Vitis vinifera TaxID=29760 RepID=A0A438FRV7_VITVI|nr:hypothetical protein CK203_062676 [Vitis vinifera]